MQVYGEKNVYAIDREKGPIAPHKGRYMTKLHFWGTKAPKCDHTELYMNTHNGWYYFFVYGYIPYVNLNTNSFQYEGDAVKIG